MYSLSRGGAGSDWSLRKKKSDTQGHFRREAPSRHPGDNFQFHINCIEPRPGRQCSPVVFPRAPVSSFLLVFSRWGTFSLCSVPSWWWYVDILLLYAVHIVWEFRVNGKVRKWVCYKCIFSEFILCSDVKNLFTNYLGSNDSSYFIILWRWRRVSNLRIRDLNKT